MSQDERKRSLEECKRRLPMPDLWKKLGLPGEPKKSMCSPFRDEDRESFSVFQHGGQWFFRDHATDEKGDEVNLIMLAKSLADVRVAIACYHDLAGVPKPEWKGANARWNKTEVSRHDATGAKKGDATTEPRRAAEGDPSTPLRSAQDDVLRPAAKPPNKGVKKEKRQLGKVVAVYDYHDESGKMVHQTVRFEPKDFRQRRPATQEDLNNPEVRVREGFVYSLEGTRTVLYRLSQIVPLDEKTPIFFVEGEKDANNLAALGLVATTVPMGANKWRDDYTAMLEGKWIVLIGDADDSGDKHVKRVCHELEVAANRIGIINLKERWPEIPLKGDISDWIAAQEDGADILAGTLTTWAQEARDPREWRGCIVMGEKGPKLITYTMAQAMVKRYEVRYAGEQWWRWRGSVWQADPVQRRVKREIQEQAVALAPYAKELVGSTVVNAIEDLMMNATAMHPDDFNQHDRALINCRNGMLDIEKMELRPHEAAHYSTVQIPWNYVPGTACPKWEAWLLERLPEEDVRELVQEMFGYCLAGNRINYHKFFFLFGDGGTGKSTVADILARMIGKENTVAVQLQELDKSFTRAALVGKRLYAANELTRDSLKHIGMVKAITSGDPIFVERKHKDGYTYFPQGRFVMTSNVRANTPDSSDGFMRRLLQITFKKKMKREEMDFSMTDKLAAEMEGIFFWSLQGLQRLMARGHFVDTADSREAANQLEMHRASVKAFMDKCVEIGEDMAFKQSVNSLYTTYTDWCEWEGVKPHYDDVAPFGRELLNRVPELKDRRLRIREADGRMMFYTGLKYRNWKEEIGMKEETN